MNDTRKELGAALLTGREQEQVEAIAAIRDEAGDSAGDLVAGLMLRNAHDIEWSYQTLYESEKADHDRARQQLREAWDRIGKIEHRHAWLLGHTDNLFAPEWEA